MSEKVYNLEEAATLSPSGEKYIVLQIGPSHPGSGHMRLVVWLDGDIIVKVDPDIGFVCSTWREG